MSEPEFKTVKLGEFLAESMIRKIEEQPITVTLRLTGGSIEVPIGPKDPWYKDLSRSKAEQIKRLRAKAK